MTPALSPRYPGMDSAPLPNSRTVTVELRGPVYEVAQVQGWIAGRAAFSDVTTEDQADGTVLCRMTVVAGEDLLMLA